MVNVARLTQNSQLDLESALRRFAQHPLLAIFFKGGPTVRVKDLHNESIWLPYVHFAELVFK